MAVGKRKGNVKPARTVEWRGSVYKVRGKVEVPDLSKMERFSALMWLNTHTYARGYSRPNPLAGFGGAIQVSTK